MRGKTNLDYRDNNYKLNVPLSDFNNCKIILDPSVSICKLDIEPNNIENDIVFDGWRIKSSMNIARDYLAGSGISTSALSFGGTSDGGVTTFSNNEEYNNNIWLNRSDLNITRAAHTGCGIVNSTLCFSGVNNNNKDYLNNTEEYNGSIWNNKANANIARKGLACCGTSSSALVFGGHNGILFPTTVEEYNGSVWNNKADMNIGRYFLAGCGASSSALSFGGWNGTRLSTVEEYNGDTWYNKASMNNTINGLAGCGASISALSYGGSGSSESTVAITEEYNGNIWFNKSNMNISRSCLAGCGTSSSALSFGGSDIIGITNNTEDYTSKKTQHITPVWSIKADMNNIKQFAAGCGNSSSALSFGGYNDIIKEPLSNTELYNGDIWTNKTNMNNIKSRLAGCGTSSSALSFGGYNDIFGGKNTELYNGDTWTNMADANTIRASIAGCGNSNSALSFGGYNGGKSLTTTDAYNGSTWNSKNDMNNARGCLAGCGNSNSALSFGGYNEIQTNLITSTTEMFNGDSWIIKSNMMNPNGALAGCGTSSSALSFGGTITYDYTTITEEYDGVSWSNKLGMNKPRYNLSGCDNSSNALSFGGRAGIELATTEQYSVRNYKIIFNSDKKQLIYDRNKITKIKEINTWYNKASMNLARCELSGCGSNSSALSFGGNKTAVDSNISDWVSYCELYNSSVWNTKASMNDVVRGRAGCGISNSALGFGGCTSMPHYHDLDSTEIYNSIIWINKAKLNTERRYIAGCGISNSALGINGVNSSILTIVEEYNGNIWTNKKNTNIARCEPSCCGNINSSLLTGGIFSYDGNDENNTATYTTEEYNGDIWTNKSNMNVARAGLASCGTSSSTLSFGGSCGAVKNYSFTTEKYNGNSWIIKSNMLDTGYGVAGCGISNSALGFGGLNESINSASTEEYIGYQNIDYISNFDEFPSLNEKISINGELHDTNYCNKIIISNLNEARYACSSCGNRDAFLVFGGYNSSDKICESNERYNGYEFTNFTPSPFSTYSSALVGNCNSALNSVLEHTVLYDGNSYMVLSDNNEYKRNTGYAGHVNNMFISGGVDNRIDKVRSTTSNYNGLLWRTKPNKLINSAYFSMINKGNDLFAFAGDTEDCLTKKSVYSWLLSTEMYSNDIWQLKQELPVGMSNNGSFGSISNPTVFTNSHICSYNGDSFIMMESLNYTNYLFGYNGAGTNSGCEIGGRDDYENYHNTSCETYAITKETSDILNPYIKINLNKKINLYRKDEINISSLNKILKSDTDIIIEDDKLLSHQYDIGNSVWKISNARLNIPRAYSSGNGSCKTALSISGSSGDGISNFTESYNDEIWKVEKNNIQARNYSSSCGNDINSLLAGGRQTDDSDICRTVELYNGSSWALKPEMIKASYKGSMSGSTNDAIYTGGYETLSERYNGVLWTAISDLNTPRFAHSSGGKYIIFCGKNASEKDLDSTELYDGASWVARKSTNISRSYSSGSGTTYNNIISTGGTGSENNFVNESYDGFGWRFQPVSLLPSDGGNSSGGSNFSVLFGGDLDSQQGFTQIYLGGDTSFETKDINLEINFDNYNSWVQVSNCNIARELCSSTSTDNTDCILVSGMNRMIQQSIEKFKNNIWSVDQIDINTYSGSLCGSDNSLIYLGGKDKYNNNTDNTKFIFDGNSVKELQNMPIACSEMSSIGVSNDLVKINGSSGKNLYFNGDSWSIITDPILLLKGQVSFGTPSNILSIGGNSTEPVSDTFILIDKSTIKLSNNINCPRYNFGGSNSCLIYGGIGNNGISEYNEQFKNNSWIISDTLNTVRHSLGSDLNKSKNIATCGKSNDYEIINTTEMRKENTNKLFEISYDSGWKSGEAIPVNKYSTAGCGLEKASILTGGNRDGSIEKSVHQFDGVQWSTKEDLITARENLGCLGNQNSCCVLAGNNSEGVSVNTSEYFNSIIWSTASNKLNSENKNMIFCGKSALLGTALCIGGQKQQPSQIERRKLLSWSIGEFINTPRYNLAGCGSGDNSLIFGGLRVEEKYIIPTSEQYSGYTWINRPCTNTLTHSNTGLGCVNNAITCGGKGSDGSSINICESFNGIAWSPIDNLLNGRYKGSGSGNSSYSNIFAGRDADGCISLMEIGINITNPKIVNINKEIKINIDSYISSNNEGVWRSVTPMNFERIALTACGSADSSLAISGHTEPDDRYLNNVELFNGINWSNRANINTASYHPSSCGNNNSALVFGGLNSVYLTNTEVYNGINWSNTSNLNNARSSSGGTGSTNNSYVTGGVNGDGALNKVEKFNGVSWSQQPTLVGNRYIHNCSSLNNGIFVASGYDGKEYLVSSELFNNEVWISKQPCIIDSPHNGNSSGSNSLLSVPNSTSYVPKNGIGIRDNCERYDVNSNIWKIDSKVLNISSIASATTGTDGDNAITCGGYNLNCNDNNRYSTAFTQRYTKNTPILEQCYSWIQKSSSNIKRNNCSSAGSHSSTIIHGFTINSELFNNIYWENSSNNIIEKNNSCSSGYSSSSLSIGGTSAIDKTKVLNTVEMFNGMEWRLLQSTMLTKLHSLAGCGYYNSTIIFGGIDTSSNTTAECYNFNGNTWAIKSSLNNISNGICGCGAYNSAISHMINNKNTIINSSIVETFNGVNWKDCLSSCFNHFAGGMSGNINTCTLFAGRNNLQVDSTACCLSENYNGSIWKSTNLTNTPRYNLGYSGSSNNALGACGFDGLVGNNFTELYTQISYNELFNFRNIDCFTKIK